MRQSLADQGTSRCSRSDVQFLTTFVNDMRVEGQTLLHDGDAIRLGRADLAIRAFLDEEGTESVREP